MSNNWWENFFYGVALDFWRAAISDEQTRAEAGFIQNQLQLSAGARIMDVPCGNGRLSIALAERGFQLTGVDIAAEFIEEAKDRSGERGLPVEWHQRDMRDLPWHDEFDGAFCFGNSFGYFDDKENTDFLKALAGTLKPGARFILDAPAIAESLLPNLQPYRSIEIAGIKVDINTRYDAEQRRMFNDFTFTRDGKTEKRPSSQRIYTFNELRALLQEAGLEPLYDCSSLEGEPYKPGAPRLLNVSKRLCIKSRGV